MSPALTSKQLGKMARLTQVIASVPGISAVPHEDNLRYFDVKIHGPSQSPYEGQSEQTRRRRGHGRGLMVLSRNLQA